MKLHKYLLPALACGAAAFLVAPSTSHGYSLIGFSLSLSQRDFRVFNNFQDTATNNNNTAHRNFPGYQGADMAIWKACVEWQAELHGDGTGDTHQGNQLGNGGANFDASFQGNANGIGGINDNIHSALNADGGGVYAFAESPSSNGWRIRYYEDPWTWSDGPGSSPSNQADLQGIATHEYGHALGLGHSTASGATMSASISVSGSDNQRSINSDDQAGLQAIYGVKDSGKPRITGVTINGSIIDIVGLNFDATGNEVWFTQAGAGGNGVPIKRANVPSTNGGTMISLALPAQAGNGDILVRKNGTAHSSLSNAWPLDTSNVNPSPPTISSFSPTQVEVITPDSADLLTINGSGFTGATSVTFDGNVITGLGFSVLNDGQIVVVDLPTATTLGSRPISVTTPNGTANSTLPIVAPSTPVLDIPGTAEPAFLFSTQGLTLVSSSDPADLYFVQASTSNLPTSIPGLLDLQIGNGGTELFLLYTPLIPAKGFHEKVLPVNANLAGTTIYFQGAVLEGPTYATPFVGTNVQSGLVVL